MFKLTSLILLIHVIGSSQDHPGSPQMQLEHYKTKPDPPVDKVHVLTGLDVLLDKKMDLIQGKSVALVTNHTGIDKLGIPNYKHLANMKDIDLKVIFSPEHGLFGEAGAGEKVSYTEKDSRLPKVISLYGSMRKPTAEMLSGINLIIYDIQDIGTRFYTYITTLGLVMEVAGELDIPVLVLDRPNPIRGDIIEGPVLNLEFQSFVGYYPISIRYGGTVGDLAKKIIKQNWIPKVPDLTVIPSEGWDHHLWFDETDLPWVSPSPNIPDLETAIIYPGMCLIEGTNISEGRGTPNPFKWIGAPWIDGQNLSQTLNKFNLPGVVFVPVSFTPVSIPGKSVNPKFENQKCSGVEVRIIDRNEYKSVDTGVKTLFALFNTAPEKFEFQENHLNRLWGSNELYIALKNGTLPQTKIYQKITGK